ncbi:MAG: 8-amino-7-oxononanoate synthase [Rhodospirillaceae bacterium]|nr:8-amino-7-oxononanoate synthase [Rhodospirillaceae bacterium]
MGLSNARLKEFAQAKLADLEKLDLRRELADTARFSGGKIHRSAKKLISFSCNDYLGLTHHPDVIKASQEATQTFGTGSGGSRLVSGNNPLNSQLEALLSKIKGTEDAVIFGSGYLANVGVIPSLVGRDDLILIDELSHSCLFAGAKLANANIIPFKHRDTTEVSNLLSTHRKLFRHCLVLTDGVFSMDGDIAPILELHELCEKNGAWLMTDDAHGLGVIHEGRGSSIVDGYEVPVPLQVGTLSKAVGAYGGYLCANREITELMRNRARSLMYTTALPPGTLAAAIAALKIIDTNIELTNRPLAFARLFSDFLSLEPPESPIVVIQLGNPERTIKASKWLEEQGYLAVAIRPPTVPEGTSRLRCTFSATHTQDQVYDFAKKVQKILEKK